MSQTPFLYDGKVEKIDPVSYSDADQSQNLIECSLSEDVPFKHFMNIHPQLFEQTYLMYM